MVNEILYRGEASQSYEPYTNLPGKVPSVQKLEEQFNLYGQSVYDTLSENAWLKLVKDDHKSVFFKIFSCIYRFPSPGYTQKRIMQFLFKAIEDISSPYPDLKSVKVNPINSLLFVVDYELLFGYDVDGEIKHCKLDLEKSLLITDEFKLPLQKNYVSCWVDAPLCWLMNSVPDFDVGKLKKYNTDACNRSSGITYVNSMFNPFQFEKTDNLREEVLYLVNVGGHYVCVRYNTDKTTCNYYDPFSGRALKCKSHIEYFKNKEHYLSPYPPSAPPPPLRAGNA